MWTIEAEVAADTGASATAVQGCGLARRHGREEDLGVDGRYVALAVETERLSVRQKDEIAGFQEKLRFSLNAEPAFSRLDRITPHALARREVERPGPARIKTAKTVGVRLQHRKDI